MTLCHLCLFTCKSYSSTKTSGKKGSQLKSNVKSGTTTTTQASGGTTTTDEFDVDVTTVDDEPQIPYDPIKARNLMGECEKHVNFARWSDVGEDWEERVVR